MSPVVHARVAAVGLLALIACTTPESAPPLAETVRGIPAAAAASSLPAERIFGRVFGELLVAEPVLLDSLTGRGETAATADGVMAATQQWAKDGRWHLGNDELQSLAGLTASLLAPLDSAQCEVHLNGGEMAAWYAMLGRGLDSAGLDRYARLTYTAALKTLKGAAARQTADTAGAGDRLGQIYTALSPEDGQAVLAVPEVSPTTCGALSKLHAGIAALPAADGAGAMRLMVSD